MTLVENEYSASDLKGIMGTCELVLGERTHALIGALTMATPCIALTVSQDHRMHNIVEEMFGGTTFDLDAPDEDQLRGIVREEWSSRHAKTSRMKARAQEIEKDARTAAELLREACCRRRC